MDKVCEVATKTLRVSQSEFIDRVRKVHGDGYDFSKSVYRGATTKVEVVCHKHGSFYITPNSLYYGTGCRLCGVEKTAGRNRLSLDEAKIRLKTVHGDAVEFPYIDDEYSNAHSKITPKCKVHGITHKVSMQDLQKGSGCPKCGYKLRNRRSRISKDEFFKVLQEKHGSTYLYDKTHYTEMAGEIVVTCRAHGDFTIAAKNHYRGYGCKKCANDKNGKARSITKSDVIKALSDSDNLTLIEMIKSDTGTKARVMCDKHGEFVSQAATIISGTRCAKCSAKLRGVDSAVVFDEFVKRARATHDYKYTYSAEGYTGVNSKVAITCPTHGVFYQRGSDHTLKHAGCPKCGTNKDSKPQIEISEFIERFGFETIRNYRFGDTKHEADIYVPELKLAIEYNGIYYHSQRFRQNSSYHLDKVKLAEKLGLRLVHIFSDEWENRRNVVESYLMNVIGLKKHFSVYARECEVGDVTNELATEFYNETHIQGAPHGGVHIGLFNKSVLVACMTFSKRGSSRNKLSDSAWELSRFASSENVVGGASRLFAAHLRETGALEVVSFSDNRLFGGSMYEKLGFAKHVSYPPNYAYVNLSGTERLHKSRFQHKHLRTLLGEAYDPTKTEKENCEAAGYYRIYDCGLTKWVWRRP